METTTTNVESDSVNTTAYVIKTAAAIALCAVAGWKFAGWTRSKIDARKDRKVQSTEETN